MTQTPASKVTFKLRLFVAGDTANSTQALGNLNALCRERIPGRYQIEVVDVFLQPERALAEAIFMTPTLIILEPLPSRRITGTLTNPRVLIDALGVENVAG